MGPRLPGIGFVDASDGTGLSEEDPARRLQAGHGRTWCPTASGSLSGASVRVERLSCPSSGSKGSPRAVALPNFRGEGIAYSPDGELMAYDATDGSLMVASMSGGDARRLPGPPVDRDDQLVTWSADGRFLFLSRVRPAWRFLRREIATGKTSRWLEFQPADLTGVTSIVAINHAGRAFLRLQLRTRRGVRPLRRRRTPVAARRKPRWPAESHSGARRGGRGMKPRPRPERVLTAAPRAPGS